MLFLIGNEMALCSVWPGHGNPVPQPECLVSLFEAIMHETILIDMYHMYHMYIHRLTALA